MTVTSRPVSVSGRAGRYVGFPYSSPPSGMVVQPGCPLFAQAMALRRHRPTLLPSVADFARGANTCSSRTALVKATYVALNSSHTHLLKYSRYAWWKGLAGSDMFLPFGVTGISGGTSSRASGGRLRGLCDTHRISSSSFWGPMFQSAFGIMTTLNSRPLDL